MVPPFTTIMSQVGIGLILGALRYPGVQWGHAMGSDSLRGQAALLLSMSIEARASGHFDLSDILTEAASRYLDRADAAERVEAPPLAPESIEPLRVHAPQPPELGRRRR
jgi:hypothetical protein